MERSYKAVPYAIVYISDCMIDPLAPDALRRRCAPETFSFDTTAELPGTTRVVGQDRAIDALSFGISMETEGYNVFALGPSGTGRRDLIRHLIDEKADDEPTPPDWCYVNNFDDPREPKALHLPAGRGTDLKEDVDDLIEDLQTAVPAVFESEEYQRRRQLVQEEVREDQEEAFESLQDRARNEDIALLRTPQGFVFAPIRDGEVISPEDMESMPEEEREVVEARIEELQDELQDILRKLPEREREARKRLDELNREMVGYAVEDLINALRESYADLEAVLDFLDAIRDDLIDNVDVFTQSQSGQQSGLVRLMQSGGRGGDENAQQGMTQGNLWRRYRVNVLVDHSDTEGAPVVVEDSPTHANLVGEVEQIAQMGALVTDFNLIQPGALHRANGGYLVLEARKMLQQPYAWEGLKRALRSGDIDIESPAQAMGLIRTITLEPEAIPLDLKIVLVGERMLYYVLEALDPELGDFFKVMADFDDTIDHTEAHRDTYADLIATIAAENDLHPFDRSAVARIVERSARLASDTEKLSAHVESIRDLATEAHHWAMQNGTDVIEAAHVQQAIDHQIHRADRLRENVQESIERGTLYIDTDGTAEGQVNGLAVLDVGGFSFGKPNRITARVRLGTGDITDIEREAALGGPLHSKGVLILSGFLQGRFAQRVPLSLSASLVFEQSYGGVDGDSASSAELYALLSALSQVPLRQDVAVTGSVNQHGQVQPIGGVNEKVEGFFDVCQAQGRTGDQGVLIPAANVPNLMLRPDIVEAAANDAFHIYPVDTIDDGIEQLTGHPAGVRGADGAYPDDSINGRVEARLRQFANRRRQFAFMDGKASQTTDA